MTAPLERLFPLFLVAVAAATLGAAYTAQYAYDLEPCVLCLYQRVPYAIVGALGIAGLVSKDVRIIRWIALLAVVAFVVEAGIAFYHVGVEQKWWASAASCGGGLTKLDSTDAFLQALQQKPAKACDEVDWTLFGISMATYNVVAALAFAAAAFVGWRRLGAGRNA